MIGLKEEFKPSSLADWKTLLQKELKGDSLEPLMNKDEIEEIEFPSFFHRETADIKAQIPGKENFSRGSKVNNNSWKNSFLIKVSDAKKANSKALEVLMKGTDKLIFDFDKNPVPELTALFPEIGFEYIETTFRITSFDQFQKIKSHFKGKFPPNCEFSVDFLTIEDDRLFDALVEENHNGTIGFCRINAYAIQQCGANTWQELAFAIYSGHEMLLRLMDKGLSVDDASAYIHFDLGVGANYFYEIAKFRAIKVLWSQIVKQYSPQFDCTLNTQINATLGFTNKSLVDPYTNLLRQTTEAMSAISGGIDSILIQPYDSHSKNSSSLLSERMALNISLILKEESYFDKVIDPLGGSYAVEFLTNTITEKAWTLFQKLESRRNESFDSGLNVLRNDIKRTSELRIEKMNNSKSVLIGINKFPNPTPENNSFDRFEDYLGMKTLNFELEHSILK